MGENRKNISRNVLGGTKSREFTLPISVLRWSDLQALPKYWAELRQNRNTPPIYLGIVEYDLTSLPEFRVRLSEYDLFKISPI